ncbi:hypothetical protein KY318_03180, partial [Candidatus Woesearchaeota archaeon]|nr:hypothetical protein [Candidatus Woesearchaeota archaeon]
VYYIRSNFGYPRAARPEVLSEGVFEEVNEWFGRYKIRSTLHGVYSQRTGQREIQIFNGTPGFVEVSPDYTRAVIGQYSGFQPEINPEIADFFVSFYITNLDGSNGCELSDLLNEKINWAHILGVTLQRNIDLTKEITWVDLSTIEIITTLTLEEGTVYNAHYHLSVDQRNKPLRLTLQSVELISPSGVISEYLAQPEVVWKREG